MGFVLTSSTQTLYAYLTQKGRNNLLFEDSDKFKITYFSLHDDDVDYKITSNIINLDFNKLPKGFVPDVTGDDDICIRSVSEANTVSTENYLIFGGEFVEAPIPPPPPPPPTGPGGGGPQTPVPGPGGGNPPPLE